MWEGIADGSIDTVGTDHVPRKRSTKAGKGIWASSNGFPGRGHDAADHARRGYHRRGIAPERIARCCRAMPRASIGMGSKGALAVGYDADIAVVDPELSARSIRPRSSRSRIIRRTRAWRSGAGRWRRYVRGRQESWPTAGIVTPQAREQRPDGRYLFRQ